MVRLAVVVLSLLAVVAAGGAVVQAVTAVPVTASPVALPEGHRSAHSRTVQVAGDAATVDSPTGSFTLAELEAGAVSAARFTAFWDAALERLRTAPCPGPTAPGATVVVATVGATPPAHLGDDYPDYAPLLAAARAEAAAACG